MMVDDFGEKTDNPAFSPNTKDDPSVARWYAVKMFEQEIFDEKEIKKLFALDGITISKHDAFTIQTSLFIIYNLLFNLPPAVLVILCKIF